MRKKKTLTAADWATEPELRNLRKKVRGLRKTTKQLLAMVDEMPFRPRLLGMRVRQLGLDMDAAEQEYQVLTERRKT